MRPSNFEDSEFDIRSNLSWTATFDHANLNAEINILLITILILTSTARFGRKKREFDPGGLIHDDTFAQFEDAANDENDTVSFIGIAVELFLVRLKIIIMIIIIIMIRRT